MKEFNKPWYDGFIKIKRSEVSDNDWKHFKEGKYYILLKIIQDKLKKYLREINSLFICPVNVVIMKRLINETRKN